MRGASDRSPEPYSPGPVHRGAQRGCGFCPSLSFGFNKNGERMPACSEGARDSRSGDKHQGQAPAQACEQEAE